MRLHWFFRGWILIGIGSVLFGVCLSLIGETAHGFLWALSAELLLLGLCSAQAERRLQKKSLLSSGSAPGVRLRIHSAPLKLSVIQRPIPEGALVQSAWGKGALRISQGALALQSVEQLEAWLNTAKERSRGWKLRFQSMLWVLIDAGLLPLFPRSIRPFLGTFSGAFRVAPLERGDPQSGPGVLAVCLTVSVLYPVLLLLLWAGGFEFVSHTGLRSIDHGRDDPGCELIFPLESLS
jgi:hypothetical protein